MIYKNKNIKVEVHDTLVSITKDDMLVKAETYKNYNEAEEAYKEVCKQVDEYIKKKGS
jgi:ribosome recycling factor